MWQGYGPSAAELDRGAVSGVGDACQQAAAPVPSNTDTTCPSLYVAACQRLSQQRDTLGKDKPREKPSGKATEKSQGAMPLLRRNKELLRH